MTRLVPLGTASAAWMRARATGGGAAIETVATADPEDFEPAYLGWEIARCSEGLNDDERRVVAALAAACILSVRAGSTRFPLVGEPFAAALSAVGFPDVVAAARRVIDRARAASPGDTVAATIGRAHERKPLIVDDEWLYVERMYALEARFCARIRERVTVAADAIDGRTLTRIVAAVSAGPPSLTDEQKRAVRRALAAPLALITGGPGTGKTATAVALVRAIAWLGIPMDQLAIAAPTGKAAQRLADAMAAGLAQSRDLADAALRAMAPAPLTLHRLLGWSPMRGQFARHENDPLPYRFVVVDEASMIDLAMMDRLLRALRADARLVLIGDADQLPSIEAGAVFRDLCSGLGGMRLTANLRVANDAGARRITEAARAVNAGAVDASLMDALALKKAVSEIGFEGVEHLAAPWSEVGDALIDRWWHDRIAAREGFAERSARVYRMTETVFDDDDQSNLRRLFEDHARCRILCVTRVRGFSTGADAINDRLVGRLAGDTTAVEAWRRDRPLGPGTLVSVQRNDYGRGLYNGDEGVVVRVASPTAGEPQLMVVFARGGRFEAFPLDGVGEVSPSFAMTVHRSQGSEFDHVMFVLPDVDIPLLSRELVYTAMTRARRSVLLVGSQHLLTRAVSRTITRFSGIADRLKTGD